MSRIFKKIFVSAFIIFYIFSLPVYSYSATPVQRNYNKYMKLTTSGAAKVAARSVLISRALAAAKYLKPIPYVGTALAIGMLAYSAYSSYVGNQDLTVANVPVPPASVPEPPPPLAPTGVPLSPVENWGLTGGAEVYMTFNLVKIETVEVCGECVKDYVMGTSDWYNYSKGHQPANPFANDTEYKLKGYRSSSETKNLLFQTCSGTTKVNTYRDVTFPSAYYYYDQGSFSPSLPSDIPWVDLNEGESSLPWSAYEGVNDYLKEAKAISDAGVASAEAAIGAGAGDVTSYKQISTTINNGIAALGPVPLTSADYTISGVPAVDGSNIYDITTGPVLPSDADVIPTEGVPPISDGYCGEYNYKNDWTIIKTQISTALAALPLYGLVNKLADLSGQGGFPHQYSLDLTSLGYGQPVLNLDAFHFNDMLAIIRWCVLTGSFILAWKIAVGGD
ncbi:MAG: hypothetical protein HZA11_07830 [Nitrospirae bacterium]|nr:hypothetical protein [Nitrospirota bacterium]